MTTSFDPFAPPFLFRTERGWVRICPCCGRYEVCFGTICFSIDGRSLERLLETVKDVRQQEGLPGWWRFQAQGEGLQVEALFSGQDIAALEELLDGTQAVLNLREMLRRALA
jgi:hypothetical protein